MEFNECGQPVSVNVCAECSRSWKRNKLPPLAYANGTFLGDVPPELRDLTFIEESIIAQSRAKCWIVHLREDKDSDDTPVTAHHQRGFKGHIIVYPQRPETLLKVLPASLEKIMTPICVIFVGSSRPTREWLKEKAKPLAVRRERILRALQWLKANNPFYADVEIDYNAVDQLPEDGLLPYEIQCIEASEGQDTLLSRYDVGDVASSTPTSATHDSFHRVVITDIDGRAPANELRAAAIRHIKQKGGKYVQVPHEPVPVNEFCNPDLFPMIYPTLFPYGIGGLEDPRRRSSLSLKRHVKHL
ncbi:hypothetical protein C8Q76DRAFT_627620, partial [Earliella scabrosa]